MIANMILQVVATLNLGLFLNDRLRITKNPIDRYIAAIILGFSSFIFPMVFFGTLFNNSIRKTVQIHFIIALIVLLNTIFSIFKKRKITIEKFHLTRVEKYLLALMVSISTVYFLMAIIYHDRGWDALNFYFPNALYFVLVDSIPAGLNPFTFFPTFKPPVNVLYITYSLIVTKGSQGTENANLYPWLLIIGTLLVIIRMTELVTDSLELGLAAGNMFLFLPITYFMNYEYAYYQDIPVMFFMTATLYFLLSYANKESKCSLILAILSGSLSILSKLSGFTIFFLIVASFAYRNQIIMILRRLMVLGIYAYLIYNTSLDQYVGYGIILIILSGYWLSSDLNTRSKYLKFSSLLEFLFVPLLVAFYWISFMIQIPNIREFIIEAYFGVEQSTIKTEFLARTSVSQIFLENGMSVSFTSSILYLFTGSMMGLFLLIPKVYGLFIVKSDNSNIQSIKNYTILFFSIWLAYHGTTSARYLTPIIPSLVILTTIGMYKILDRIKSINGLVIPKLVLISSSGLFYYPFIPIRLIFYSTINERIFYYHQNQLILLLYATLLPLTFFYTIQKYGIKNKVSKLNWAKILSIFILISFIAPQAGIYVVSDYDTVKFYEISNYNEREEYKNLIKFVKSYGMEYDEKILSVDTPGLSYFTGYSVIDVQMLGRTNFTDTISTDNTTRLLEIYSEYKIKMVIHLNVNHTSYETFNSSYVNMPLFRIVNEPEFELVFVNGEFKVFARVDKL